MKKKSNHLLRLFNKFAAALIACTMAATIAVPNIAAAENSAQATADAPRSTLAVSKTYPTQYKDWTEALLGGNGYIGIMVFGNPLDDTIIFNDRLFNMAADVNHPERSFDTVDPDIIEQIKQACVQGDFQTANDLANNVSNWQDGGEKNRHPGYEMKIKILGDGGEVSDYSRTCDYTTGEIAVNWTDNRGSWKRTAFVSRKDNVAVQQLTNPTGADRFDCSLQLTTDPQMNLGGVKFSDASTEEYLNIRAIYPNTNEEAGYEGVTRVLTDGEKTLSNGVLTIQNATYVTTLTRSAKYYTGCKGPDGWDKQQLQTDLGEIATDYDTLMQGQIETHKEIYDRVSLNLGASDEDRAKTNEELMAEQRESKTPILALYERIFYAGRYHYLSSSSEETPPDLLGIWTGDTNVGWSGFYHLDANLNLQIASGNIGNMPEAMAGYFNIVKSWTEDFKTNAKKLLNCDGVLAGGNTPGLNAGLISDIRNRYYPYQSVTGEESWLLYPFWEYYQITGDEEFLRNDLYPILKEVGYFYESFLTEKDENGNYIFAGSISPESQPNCAATRGNSVVNNSTFDIAGAEFGLQTLLEVCDLLGIEESDEAHISAWQELYDHLPPYLVNNDGALCEWSWPSLTDATGYGHRHSSHMVGIWPYGTMNQLDTPELYEAAQMALQRKDGAGMYEGAGHGILHGALNAAKLNNPKSVLNKLQWLLQKNFYYDSSLSTSHYDANNSDVFCTDVANTVPGIIMEMMLSSSSDSIELLPAVPDELGIGSITGLKAKNQTTVESLEWDLLGDKRTVTCTLLSDKDQTLTLIQNEGIVSAKAEGAELADVADSDTTKKLTLHKGQRATITLELTEKEMEDTTNLALGKPSKASYEESGYTADLAFDGDQGTRWSNDHENKATQQNGFLQVDLGQIYTVSSVHLYWEVAYGKQYKIQTSLDGETWEDAYIEQNSDGGLDKLNLGGINARYVRMQGVQPATGYGYSLYEFEAYGSSANLALGRPVKASDYSGPDREPELAVDGDTNTRWSCSQDESNWFQIDLGKLYDISKVNLLWEDAYAKRYKIQVSDDSEHWTDVYVEDNSDGGLDELTLSGAVGRYVRMQGVQHAGQWGYSLWEIEVYGSEVTEIPDTDKTILNRVIEYAQAQKEDPAFHKVITDVQQSFTAALDQAEKIQQNKLSTQEQVDAAWKTLMTEIHKLGFVQGNKDSLKTLVIVAQEIQTRLDDYIEAGKAQFLAALETAERTLDSGNAMQQDVDDASSTLIDTMVQLRLRADKKLLQQVLAAAEALDLSSYSEVSVEAFQAAYAQASAIAADESLSTDEQDQVDEAVNMLSEAIKNLSYNDRTSSNLSINGDSSTTATTANAKTGETAPIVATLILLTSAAFVLKKRR